jgi:hypothetical protein
MTTTNKAGIVQLILAIDLGKYNSMACDYRAATGQAAFRRVGKQRVPCLNEMTR